MSDTLNLVERPDGTIVNETNQDPAVTRLTGYRRYWVSVDLGQANDFTAICVLEDKQIPEVTPDGAQLGPRRLNVVYADRFRGVSYVAVVDHLVRLKNAPPFGGKSQLVIDGTSIGRVVSDMFDDQGVPHFAIQMTSGQEWRRSGKYINAGKTFMIENTAVMFASGELQFAQDLPLRDEIEADLATFTTSTTAAGNQVITQQRSRGGHGDLGIALIAGSFAASYLKSTYTGVSKLVGWY